MLHPNGIAICLAGGFVSILSIEGWKVLKKKWFAVT